MNVPRNNVCGWDIGGAQLKIAQVNNLKSVVNVMQVECPLWLGTNELREAISRIDQELNLNQSMHVITMTGELVDNFKNRKEGVASIVEGVSCVVNENTVEYFSGKKGLVPPEQAVNEYKLIASANWLASATFIATQQSDALFIDIGSTTTDIITIINNEVVSDGYTDAERLFSQELVYCGVVRTPVFALCKSAPIKDKFIPIMNEYFANMADVYRLTEELPQHADLWPTLDRRDKNFECSSARLARMFGYDAMTNELHIWQKVARYVREQQVQAIINPCRKHLLNKKVSLDTPIIGAGVGRFLIKEIANRLNRKFIDFSSLIDANSPDTKANAGDCAPAVSLACLGYQRKFA